MVRGRLIQMKKERHLIQFTEHLISRTFTNEHIRDGMKAEILEQSLCCGTENMTQLSIMKVEKS